MNYFRYKLSYKIWLIHRFTIVDDVKPLLIEYLITVEKMRTFRSPNVTDLVKDLHIDTDGYPIYINKDGIVFQHLYKIPLKSLKCKLTDLYYVTKRYNNIIYNYNIYRDDCYFIIHYIKSYINNILSFIPIKIVKYDIFHREFKYNDYLVTCN